MAYAQLAGLPAYLRLVRRLPARHVGRAVGLVIATCYRSGRHRFSAHRHRLGALGLVWLGAFHQPGDLTGLYGGRHPA